MDFQLLKPFIQTASSRNYKRGEIIYHEGDEPQNLFIVESGLVGLFHISENGKETFLRVFGKTALFGHRSHIANEPYHATAIVLADSSITAVSKNQFESICTKHPELLKEIAQRLAKDLRTAELRMAGLQDKSAFKRIAESMIFLKLKYPEQVWTRKEIAEYSGSTFESVTRAMTEFENNKLIKKLGRDFEIINYDHLMGND